MVDFLGRRRLCARLEDYQGTRGYRAERERLSCATLAREEEQWRARIAGDEIALAWLAVPPHRFRLQDILVETREYQQWAKPHRVELAGSDLEGNNPFRLLVEIRPRGSVSFFLADGRRPRRRLTLPLAGLPLLDLRTLQVWVNPRAPDEAFSIDARFGYERGYCAVNVEDDRPRLKVYFPREGKAEASIEDRTNCETAWIDLEVEETRAGP
jgi:hypothetical protein